MPTKHYSTTSNQKQVIPRPKPSARPPREVDYEDDFYQETERNKRGADYYDAISVEAPDLKVESHSSAPVVQKLNCMQFIRDLWAKLCNKFETIEDAGRAQKKGLKKVKAKKNKKNR